MGKVEAEVKITLFVPWMFVIFELNVFIEIRASNFFYNVPRGAVFDSEK